MKIITMIGLCFIVCCCQQQHTVTTQLIGKTIEYQYGEDIYHVSFDSDTTLHWQAKSGNETDTVYNEIYVAEWTAPHLLFITWGEANGTGVSQVLDFKKGKVYNHLLHEREVSKGEGLIYLLN